jgi:hypothetical protein
MRHPDPVPARRSFQALRMLAESSLSQCCDIAPRRGRILQPTIALARLIPVPPGLAGNADKLASLQANKYPLNPEDPGYINLFHIPEHPLLDGREWVVDYNQVLSIPATEFPEILQRKILQMNDFERIKFKIKLATSFGRVMEEEQAIDHPWLRPPEIAPAEGAGDVAMPPGAPPLASEPPAR